MSPFSTERMLDEILDWVKIESPTYAPETVERMQGKAAERMRRAGFTTETIPGRDGVAGVTIARKAGRSSLPGLLVIGHLDTVHPIGTLAGPLPIRRDGDRCYGPGIYDMKAGIMMALTALEGLNAPDVPVTILVNGDEEIGSPFSRPIIEEEAKKHTHVLIPEPAFGPSGEVTTGRFAFHRFTLTTHGRPAHSGWTNKEGRSAIRIMAQLIEEIEARSDFDRGPSYSVGVVNGGQWVNCVPITCAAQALCVARVPEQSAQIDAVMTTLQGERNGVRIEVEKGPVRPLWNADKGTLGLYDQARSIAAGMGFELPHAQHGGGSDGNFTGALGIPTLDGLGAVGHGAHTHEEHILVSSIQPRTAVLADLFKRLLKGGGG